MHKKNLISIFLLCLCFGDSFAYLISGPVYCTSNDLKTTCPTTTPILAVNSAGGLTKYATICAGCNKSIQSAYFLSTCTSSQRTAKCTNSKVPVCGLGSSGLKNYINDCAACAATTGITQYFYGPCPAPPSGASSSASPAASPAASTTTKPTTPSPASSVPSTVPKTTTTTQIPLSPTTSTNPSIKNAQYMDILPGVDDNFVIQPSNDDPNTPMFDSYGMPIRPK